MKSRDIISSLAAFFNGVIRRPRLPRELRLYDDHVQILRDGPRKFLRFAQNFGAGLLRMTALIG